MIFAVVSSIRSRLASLRKKIAVMAKHSSAPMGTSPGKVAAAKVRPASPAIAGISPPR
jgi:serine/threonine-protein kinase ULK/ATG1